MGWSVVHLHLNYYWFLHFHHYVHRMPCLVESARVYGQSLGPGQYRLLGATRLHLPLQSG